MPQFETIEQAFEWFLENTYPNLSPEQKTPALRMTKSAYYKGIEKISEKRMTRILNEFCDYQVMHHIKNKG